MTILGVLLFILGIMFVYVYMILIISNPTLADEHLVIRRIESTFLGKKSCNIRISTAIINKTSNHQDRQIGIVVMANKIIHESVPLLVGRGPRHISKDLILPLNKEQIKSIVSALKNNKPLNIQLGNTNQLTIRTSDHSNSLKAIFNPSHFLAQPRTFAVSITAETMNKLIRDFEQLLLKENEFKLL